METGASLLPKAIASLSLLSYIEGLPAERDRALFGICLYTTARVNEACSLHTVDVYGADGRVRDRITFGRATTKGKQETRSVPVSPELRELLRGIGAIALICFLGGGGAGIFVRSLPTPFYGQPLGGWGLRELALTASVARQLPGCTTKGFLSNTFSRSLDTRACRRYSDISM